MERMSIFDTFMQISLKLHTELSGKICMWFLASGQWNHYDTSHHMSDCHTPPVHKVMLASFMASLWLEWLVRLLFLLVVAKDIEFCVFSFFLWNVWEKMHALTFLSSEWWQPIWSFALYALVETWLWKITNSELQTGTWIAIHGLSADLFELLMTGRRVRCQSLHLCRAKQNLRNGTKKGKLKAILILFLQSRPRILIFAHLHHIVIVSKVSVCKYYGIV